MALRRGDVDAASRYFALPSVFANGPVVVIHNLHQAQAVNEALPCGALLLSTVQHRRYIAASFRLTNRKGPDADCGSGTGGAAAVDFVIRDGHIVDWIRAPAGGGAPQVPATPATPSNPAITGATV